MIVYNINFVAPGHDNDTDDTCYQILFVVGVTTVQNAPALLKVQHDLTKWDLTSAARRYTAVFWIVYIQNGTEMQMHFC